MLDVSAVAVHGAALAVLLFLAFWAQLFKANNVVS